MAQITDKTKLNKFLQKQNLRWTTDRHLEILSKAVRLWTL